MKDLAEKHNNPFTWFYGEPGHGRGLFDARMLGVVLVVKVLPSMPF